MVIYRLVVLLVAVTKDEMLMLSPWSPWMWMKDYPATCRLTCLRELSAQHRLALFIGPSESFPFCLFQLIALSETIWQTTELFYIKTPGWCPALPGAAHFSGFISIIDSSLFSIIDHKKCLFSLCHSWPPNSNTGYYLLLNNVKKHQWKGWFSLWVSTFEKSVPGNSATVRIINCVWWSV